MHKLLKSSVAGLAAAVMLLSQTSAVYAEIGPGVKNTPEVVAGTSPGAEAAGSAASSETAASTETSASVQAETAAVSEVTVEGGTTAAETPVNAPYVQIQLMTADRVWSDPVTTDAVLNMGESGALSACIYLNNVVGNIHYRTYVSAHGWSDWCMNGQQTKIWEDSSPIEAIQIRLSGYANNKYSLYYTAGLSDGTTLDWATNGQTAGAMANGKKLSTLRMALWEKNTTAWPYPTEKPLSAATTDGVILNGGVATFSSGTGAVFSGWGWNGGDRYYFIDNTAVTGWQYVDGYKYYFDETGKLVTDLEPMLGTAGPFYIKINKEMNTLTIFAKDGENGYIIPVKSFLCSTGDDTPLGEHKTPEKYRWRLMNTAEYCQYCTRLGAGLPILMHSVIYETSNSHTLKAFTYNYLGATKSHGCIRLTTADAKWIYDNCPLGTTVYVYESNIPGPYERPAIEQIIPDDQNFDPTDPNA